MRPSKEYLRILDELVECRDDESLQRVQRVLQQYLNRNRTSIPKDGFVESYKRGDCEIHLHGVMIPIGEPDINFCAVINSHTSLGSESGAPSPMFMDVGTRSGNRKVSVLVDVRELRELPERTIDIPSRVVRLHTLDECVSLFGNPREVPKTAIRQRGSLSGLEGLGPNRKLAFLVPVSGQSDPARIELDEIESQVIQHGTHLVDSLPSQDSDFNGRRLRPIDCSFALRISNQLRRITSGVSINVALNGLHAFFYPFEFRSCGDETFGH